MNTPVEKTEQVEGKQFDQMESLQQETSFHEVDQAAVEQLGARYQEYVPPERIAAMKELPTAFEDRETFDETYQHKNGGAADPGEKIYGYSLGTVEPAHVATDDSAKVEEAIYHERLHQMSAPGIEQQVGHRLDEGITEDLAIENLRAARGNEGGPSCYPTERMAAHMVRETCGDEAVEKAYFQGDTRELRMCLDKDLGENGLQRLRQSLDDLPDVDERQT